MRGAIFILARRAVAGIVTEKWGKEMDVLCLHFADLMGGKICAALNRQHPRDLFDVKYFFEHKKLTEKVKEAFIVCLILHQRPIHEVLNPNLRDISSTFHYWFSGMAGNDVTLEELHDTRFKLIKTIRASLTNKDKKFLVGFKNLSPDWELLGVKGVADFPAVKWKILNLRKMTTRNRQVQLKLLENVLAAD